MVGVRPGELLHRPLLDPYRPCEQHYPLGGRERRRIGYGGPAGWQHVAQAAGEVSVQVFGASAGEERLFGERHGGGQENRHEHEKEPRYSPLLALGGSGAPVLAGVRALPGRINLVLHPSAQRGVLRGEVLRGGGDRGAPGVRFHRRWHGEAGGRVEGVPADTWEVDLDPRVHVAPGDHVLAWLDLLAGSGAVDDPGRYAALPQEERHRGGELGAEALPAIAQELLYSPVRPAVVHIEGVDESAVVDQVPLDGPGGLVRGLRIVVVLDLLRRLGDDFGAILRELQELLPYQRRVAGARVLKLSHSGLGDPGDHLVVAALLQGLGERPGSVGVLRGGGLGGANDLVATEDEVGMGVQDLEALPHGFGLHAGGDLFAVLRPRLRSVPPPDAVEVVEGAPAPEER